MKGGVVGNVDEVKVSLWDPTSVDSGELLSYNDDGSAEMPWITIDGILRQFTIGQSLSFGYSANRVPSTLESTLSKTISTATTTSTSTSTTSVPFSTVRLVQSSVTQPEIIFENSAFRWQSPPSFVNTFNNWMHQPQEPKMTTLDSVCQQSPGEMVIIALMVFLTISTIFMNVLVIFLFLSNRFVLINFIGGGGFQLGTSIKIFFGNHLGTN